MKKYLFLFCLFSWNATAAVTATLSRGVVTEGQTVELTLTSDAKQAGAPDYAPLQANFAIGGQSRGQTTSVINGHMTTHQTAAVVLKPLRAGEITVPPLSWGTEQTQPISLVVTPVSDKAANDSLLMNAELSAPSVYEGQGVIYKARVLDRAGLIQGEFLPPVLADATVQVLGNDEQDTVQREGKTYRRFTRTYVIFPKQTGSMTIAPASFRGLVEQEGKNAPSDPFDFFYTRANGQQVSLRAEPLSVEVKPRPVQGKWWLPSTDVTMTETFSPPQDEIKAGEAITRHVTIKALGVLGAQIPDLTMTAGDGFKVYPAHTQKEDYQDGTGLVGMSNQTFIIVPTKDGAATIPPLALDWFDVSSKTEKTASVAGKTISVFGAPTPTSAPVPTEAQKEPSPALPSEQPYLHENNFLVFVVGLSVGILAVLIFVGVARLKRKDKTPPLPPLYPY